MTQQEKKEAAQRVVDALFRIAEDTFYDEDARQIDTSGELDMLMGNYNGFCNRGHIFRFSGDEAVAKAWRALAKFVEEQL